MILATFANNAMLVARYIYIYIYMMFKKCNCGEINEKNFPLHSINFKNLYKKYLQPFTLIASGLKVLRAGRHIFSKSARQSIFGLCGELTCCLWRKAAQPVM